MTDKPTGPKTIGDITSELLRRNPGIMHLADVSPAMAIDGALSMAVLDKLAFEARARGNIEAQAMLAKETNAKLERDLAAANQRNTELQGVIDSDRVTSKSLSEANIRRSQDLDEARKQNRLLMQALYELHDAGRNFALSSRPSTRRPGSSEHTALSRALKAAGELTSKHVPF